MQQQDRLHSLDAVRAFALLLGVVFHSTMSFLPGYKETGWLITDNSPSWSAAGIHYVLHIFRMTTFFVIAGFFARLVYHRKGTAAFIKDRVKRIGLPFVLGWIGCMVLFSAVIIWASFKVNGALPTAPPTRSSQQPSEILTHLWFLYSLLWLYAIVLTTRALIVGLDGDGAIREKIDAVMKKLVNGPFAPLVLATPLCVALYFLDSWIAWFGIPTPNRSLLHEHSSLIGFGTAFGFGWLLQRQPLLLGIWEKRWPVYLAISIALTAICLYLTGMNNVFAEAPTGPPRIIYAACYTTAIWTWCFAIIGLGMRFCSGESPLRRYVADSSYWLYIAHLPLVFALQVLVMQWPIYWWIKFIFILTVSYLLLFLSYHYWVRPTAIGAVLNGRKYPRSSLLEVWRGSRAESAFSPTHSSPPP